MGTLAIKAAGIWPGCPDDLVINFNGEDLEDYRPMDLSNVSPWIDLTDMEHGWFKGGRRLATNKPKLWVQESEWQGKIYITKVDK